MRLGAEYLGDGKSEFVVWAPFKKRMAVHLLDAVDTVAPMKRDKNGYWKTVIHNQSPGVRYYYTIENTVDRPDPASHYQPEGVHGPSQVIDHDLFAWDDNDWQGIPLSEMILYEIHVGTFTQEGTFDAMIPRVTELGETGFNAIELMPVAQFPGARNWGYDGTYPFAVQNSYGGPEGLKRFVNACHTHGIAVVLDVVYNHLGPEGNYLGDFGPYFTDKYKTPWGDAINFDDAYNDEVRNFFFENAYHWYYYYHIDALRLDAIHGITDMSAKPFLQELTERIKVITEKSHRTFHLIAESDLNDVRVISPAEQGGFGLGAQWNDDFHHSLHTLLTGEKTGYYADFGTIEHFLKAMKEGFVYSWTYSEYRKRYHGSSSNNRPYDQFIVSAQNHDQVGNRVQGDRLSVLVSFEALKLAAGAVICSPFIPLLFMGEEYGERAPFIYFVDHADHELIQAVRSGRKREFQHFSWQDDPPDPQDIETFLKSKIDWEKRTEGQHNVLLNFYRRLMVLRREIPSLCHSEKKDTDVFSPNDGMVVCMQRSHMTGTSLSIMNFSPFEVSLRIDKSKNRFRKRIDSADQSWSGPGSVLPDDVMPHDEIRMQGLNFALYVSEGGS
ncbi:MAG: malto-oligosyltrehalose trehalohydrolase [Nitrospiraceae bacterium]|jgi:maltooligosyltrehalose trehalohydrolase|nr:MAG: malto-oligosyltrehalose trehalohydrolase [Nitrospiraceae bacterium]